MRILVSSHYFYPSVGGLEATSAMLASEFHNAGHEVRLVTASPACERYPFPFEIIAAPSMATLVRLVKWSEVVWHNNISLRSAWPLLFVSRPWIVTHQTWLSGQRDPNTTNVVATFKRLCARAATNVAISRAIADALRLPCIEIPNSYDDAVFGEFSSVPRDRDAIFVGRLVSDKGVELLIRAIAVLVEQKVLMRLSIVGSGPQLRSLKELTAQLKIQQLVRFEGTKTGGELCQALNRHKLIVVPSLWHEPFGVVALEGIACGCVVVGSAGGGLRDAIGPCGVTFTNHSLTELVGVLRELMSSSEELLRYRRAAPEHLRAHRKGEVAKRYLELFQTATKAR